MMTRTENHVRSGLLTGLLLGALAINASAADAVNGQAAEAGAARSEQAQLDVEMKSYLKSLNQQLKNELDKGLKQQPRANIKLALGESPSRG